MQIQTAQDNEKEVKEGELKEEIRSKKSQENRNRLLGKPRKTDRERERVQSNRKIKDYKL